jgi:hypothetical protein
MITLLSEDEEAKSGREPFKKQVEVILPSCPLNLLLIHCVFKSIRKISFRAPKASHPSSLQLLMEGRYQFGEGAKPGLFSAFI